MTPEHEALVKALGELRRKAGEPSLRAISNATGGLLSHSSVSDMLAGRRLPRWQSVAAVVNTLVGNRDQFYRLWEIAWLARPDPRERQEELGVYLAANLDVMLRVVAEASAENLELLAHCKRCRNRLLYLLRPGSTNLEDWFGRRLRVLYINHESHGDAVSYDDATPKII